MSSSSEESDDSAPMTGAVAHQSLVRTQLKKEESSESASSSSDEDSIHDFQDGKFVRPSEESSESGSFTVKAGSVPGAMESGSGERVVANDSIPQGTASDSSSSDEDEEEPSRQLLSGSGAGNRLLKHEPCSGTSDSESEEEEVTNEVARPENLPVRRSFSKDEETLPVVQRLKGQSSSSETSDDENHLTVKQNSSYETKHLMNQVVRPAHSMSSSDSEDSDQESASVSSNQFQSFNNIQQKRIGKNTNESGSQGTQDTDSSSDSDDDLGTVKKEKVSDNVETSTDDSDALSEPKDNSLNGSDGIMKQGPGQGEALNKLIPNIFQTMGRHSEETGENLLNAMFKHCKSIDPAKAILSLEEISSNDEIWLIQCPKSMDATSLKKQQLNLEGSRDIQIEDGQLFKRFSISSEPSTMHALNCILPSSSTGKFHITSLPVKGNIIVEEHVHVPKLKSLNADERGPVPLPEGLRVRHPLLGVGFEKHMASVTSALRESHNSYKLKERHRKLEEGNDNRAAKKSRKRKHGSFDDVSIDEVDGSTTQQVQKKQKLNMSSDQLLEPFPGNCEVSNPLIKRKKDKHKDVTSNDINASFNFSHIDVSHEKDSKKRKRSLPSTESSGTLVESDESNVRVKKQKKNKKTTNDQSICSDSQGEQTFNSSFSSVFERDSGSQKHHKRKSEVKGSSNLSNVELETDTMAKSSAKKQKKSKISDISENSGVLLSLNSSSYDDSVRKKHKKQKKSQDESPDKFVHENAMLSESKQSKASKKLKKEPPGTPLGQNLSIPSWHTPQTAELPHSVLDEMASIGTASKKKKKSKNHNSEGLLSSNEIKQEDCSFYNTSMENELNDSVSRKKNKKKHKEHAD